MLSPDQKREILALVLMAAALFLFLALVPVSTLGPRGETWFPSGNVVGTAGIQVRNTLVTFLGLSSVLLPVLLSVAGLQLVGWIGRGTGIRAGAFGVGLGLLLPPALHVFAADAGMGGRLGRLFGEPLREAIGWVGVSLLLVAAFAVLSVATLGWNPLRLPGRAGVAALRGGGRLGRGAVGGVVAALAAIREWGRRGRRRIRIGGRRGKDRRSGRSAPAVSTRRSKAGSVPAEPAPEPAPEPATPEPPRPSQPDLPPEPEPEPFPAPGSADRNGAPAMGEDLPDPMDPEELLDRELPSLELLAPARNGDRDDTDHELDRLGQILVEKLQTFNVESEVAGRTTGPVVTQYELVPAPGVKVNRIANLEADLALAMKARTIRIVAPIPGKGAVGVEIPNPTPQIVRVREILESGDYERSRAALPLALGKDLHGAPYVADLASMPHCLIAGATGSGKSVCLNTVITSLVYRHPPESLRLLLVDPKMVELSTYQDLPHLRHPVVTDPKDAAGVLKWAVLEMERRYALLSKNGVRSIREFNQRVRDGQPLRRAEPAGPEDDPDRWIYDGGILPYIVLVIDELADLMMTVQAEVEKPLTHLAQKARAIGIHLIVATQRPSVNVITGLIKANFPCRIAFRVASKTDSRTILDQNGADALLGNGDMLFLPPGRSAPARIQGAFMSTEETERLVSWFRERRDLLIARAEEEAAEEDPAVQEEEDILEMVREQEAEEAVRSVEDEGAERDELFREAAEVCIRNDQGSTSLLQRRLRIGYGRAARIVDQLHEAGVLGPPDGSKPREVLVGPEELDGVLSAKNGGA